MEEFKRMHTLGHYFNIESHLVSPNEAQKICTVLDPKVIRGAIWIPSDGYTEPSMYCAALIKGATTNGGVVSNFFRTFMSSFQIPIEKHSKELNIQNIKYHMESTKLLFFILSIVWAT